jgi:hypothetical protein
LGGMQGADERQVDTSWGWGWAFTALGVPKKMKPRIEHIDSIEISALDAPGSSE